MLNEAGDIPKMKESYNVFVRGLSRANEFIAFDFEKDHIPLTREQVSVSINIDSIIWVTQRVSCKGAINLHLTPCMLDHPPFSSNPAVYINIL